MKFAYAITTWSGARLNDTLDSIPQGSRVLVVDNRRESWPLAKGWNFAVDKLLWNEAYDACIIANDDVIFREDTGELLAWGITEGQFLGTMAPENLLFENYWPGGKVPCELLLLSARHASWSDACTDVVDETMLREAKPVWQPSPDFSCFIVTRRLGQIIGRFDELFVPCYFEDNDTHRRIRLAGYEAGALAPYWHFRNGTIRSDPTRATVISNGGFENSKRRYCAKWGAPYPTDQPVGKETFLTPFGR